MPKFTIEGLEELIATAEHSLVKMLALQLDGEIRRAEKLEVQNLALVAENKKAIDAVTVFSKATEDLTEIIADELGHDRVAEVVAAFDDLGDTPVTEVCMSEIRAKGRIEGVNFAASRLAAAFNHGFVEKPLAEVFDVVRMILTAKEDLTSNPAEDGLSGEYAEKSLVKWQAMLEEVSDDS